MKIDSKKVAAIMEMGPSTGKQVLESFQGMVNYLTQFSAKITRESQPLKELLRNDTLWVCKKKHQEVYEAVKKEIANTPVLAYFNSKKEHIIQTDGSKKGSGSCSTSGRVPRGVCVTNAHTCRRSLLKHRVGAFECCLRIGEATSLCLW